MQSGDTVFFLDYTGPGNLVEAVAAQCKRVVVLDHHQTSSDALSGRSDLPTNVDLHIDMQHSGARLAHDFFQSITARDLHRRRHLLILTARSSVVAGTRGRALGCERQHTLAGF